MTPGEFFATLGRRWYVLVVMLVGVATAAVFLWPGQHVYSARSSVTFLWPGSASVSKTDDGGLAALVNFAAMVRLAVDDGQAAESTSFGGSLVGAGVRRGFTIVLPNSGGQWSSEYDQPKLVIETVAASPDAASTQTTALAREIVDAAVTLQKRVSVPSEAYIATAASPVEVVDGGATLSTRTRGEAAAVAVGLFVTAVTTVTVDRALRTRRRTQTRAR